ncbi:MAG: hypothetical protein Q9220_001675 [cf. Caloplaca sp. 1 TL-2023]
MVSTRGQRPPAPGLDVTPVTGLIPVEQDNADASTLAVQASAWPQEPATSPQSRKRRRSASAIIEEPGHALKRPNLRKTVSPIVKRTPGANGNSKASHERTAVSNAHRGPEASTHDHTFAAQQDIERETNGILPNAQAQEHNGATKTLSRDEAGADPAGSHADMHDVITQIIDHGETIEGQLPSGPDGSVTTTLGNNGNVLSQGASLQLKVQSLPILDNLAVQILTTFANSSFQELLTLTSDVNSEPGAAYSTLKSLFGHTKKVYSIGDPFLSSQELGLVESGQVETIRKANLATFVSSVFGSQDVGFYHLNEFFLDTFVADGARLLKNQAGLYLDLKTQAYISAITNGERSREDILYDLFPPDLEQRLLSRRSGAKQLAPGEFDFIQRANNRKKALREEPMTSDFIARLIERYVWEDFLRDISTYVSKNLTAVMGPSARRPPTQNRSTNVFEVEPPQQSRRQAIRRPPQAQPVQSAEIVAPLPPNIVGPRVAQMVPPTADDIAEKAARAAEFAMQGFSVNHEATEPSQTNAQQDQSQPQPQQYPYQFEQQPAPYYTQNHFNSVPPPMQTQLQQQQQQQQPPQQSVDLGTQTPSNTYVDTTSSVPYPTQTAPTAVLYERARLAATAKASPSNRRAGHPSQRRPWSQEEENALMAGLDHVKGPHWSQILALYGPGGTLNETLKDRNQVQLKDKARNLKLFFLKSGIEVPYYLQFVTGELKTRAPQAARVEEEKRLRERDKRVSELAAESVQQQQQQQRAGTGDGGLEEREDEEQEGNMEDGEGEIIDPAEYAAVHGAGRNVDGQEGGQDGGSEIN